ncbi:MAG: hypothetical protein HOV79_25225 [Hamadaea sp.]|nr:hypothetical protein [Hamadaea sp.]
MSDLLTEERTRAAFSEAAAAQLAFVQAPGVAAAQRTVRRRRTTAVSGVAAVAAVALTGGFVLATRTPDSPDVAHRPDQSVDARQLSELAETALKRAVPDLDARTVSGGSGGMESNVMNVDETVAAAAYVMAMTCVGPGTVAITWTIGTASVKQDVTCGSTVEEAAGRAVELSLPRPGGATEMTVQFAPDASATGHAAFAYRVLTP